MPSSSMSPLTLRAMKLPVDVVDDDAAFIHGFYIDIDVAGNVEDEIHFDDVAVLVAAAARAAGSRLRNWQRNGPLT